MNPNHELDLGLIQKYGLLSNYEVRLSEKEFLTDDKIDICSNIVSALLQKKEERTMPLAK